MKGGWDIGKKGERTQHRLNFLKQATRNVVRERPELKTQPNRLCSAVFAKLKRDGAFRPVNFAKATGPLNQRRIYWRFGVWNEKEFFYRGNYHWTRADIVEFANEERLPLWLKIGGVILGILLIRKLLK